MPRESLSRSYHLVSSALRQQSRGLASLVGTSPPSLGCMWPPLWCGRALCRFNCRCMPPRVPSASHCRPCSSSHPAVRTCPCWQRLCCPITRRRCRRALRARCGLPMMVWLSARTFQWAFSSTSSPQARGRGASPSTAAHVKTGRRAAAGRTLSVGPSSTA